MTSPGLLPGCSVWVDGVRMADGQVGEDDLEPVALTNLRVTWGRENTLDQPPPATCSFQVLDIAGGRQFLDVLGIGKRITVRADASIYPDPTVSTMLDPGFELAPVGSTPSTRTTNATVVVDDTQAATLSHSARVQPVDGTRAAVVIFPPAPFDVIPSAWDDIPRVSGGQKWRFGASVKTAGAPAAFVLNPVYFTSPNPAVPYVIDRTAIVGAPPPPDANGWQVVAGDVVPPRDVWVGLALTVFPNGPAWDDFPVETSWDALPAGLAWRDLASTFVDDLLVLAPAAGALRSGAVFDGRVSDMTARYSLEVGGTVVDVIAQDDTAELANRYVGAAPFPLESLLTRFGRIVNESGQSLQYIVDPGAQPFSISWQDVDSQPATGLLQKLAQSVTGVLWSATSLASGPYLRLEDVNSRPALFRLVSTPPGLRNLFTRPSFEDNSTSAFGATNGTLTTPTTVTPAPAGSGARVLRNTATAAGAVNAFLQNAYRVPVTPAKLYRATVWVRAVANGGAATFRVDGAYRDSAGASIGSGYNSGAQPLNSTVWRRVTLNLPLAPANAVTMSISLNVNAGATAGQAFEFDAIQVTEIKAAGDPEIPYFDGDTVDAGGAFYGWDGARWNSTSTRSGTLSIEVAPVVESSGIELDACSVLLEPVRWQQDSQDDSTRVAITWRANSANPTPPPAIQITEHDYVVSDPVLEAATGRRRVQVTTMLALESEAQSIAVQLLARLQTPGWRLSGLTIDLHYETLDPAMLARIMRILDASTRLGLPILLTGVPEWSPAGDAGDQALFLEGGRFTYDTAWRLELLVSSAVAQGKSLLRWVDMPAGVPWEAFPPDISWNDLQGVGL